MQSHNDAVIAERHVVIVTGAGGVGCGRAIAMHFARAGAAVIVSDVNETGGNETVHLIEGDGGRAAFLRTDVRIESQVQDLVSFAETTFGAVTVLVNNASAPPGGDSISDWMGSLETDLMGTIYATRWAIEVMRRGGGGAIVNLASISALWHGRMTSGGFPGFDVAKSAVIRMTTRLAALAEQDRIYVNCLASGWIATDGVLNYWESLTPAERLERGVPSRLLTVDQVAETVMRLASDRSLAGRVLAWWSEDEPRLITWGDRGYRNFEAHPFSSR